MLLEDGWVVEEGVGSSLSRGAGRGSSTESQYWFQSVAVDLFSWEAGTKALALCTGIGTGTCACVLIFDF